ncbi:MAG: long-chain fatty acid--CoA ligase [Pseudomonadota bacterium]|nr:MAG: long-chain fatty acid--CoA ligase [Pseudomonadota bacterium]
MPDNIDYIPAENTRDLAGLFLERVRRSPERVAYRHFDTASAQWIDTTWAEMAGHVARWQAAMRSEGLQAGDRVALMLRNCREWVMFDQAALGLGLVVVPLYPNDRAENIAYILNDSDARLFFFEGHEHWETLRPVHDQLGKLQRIVTIEQVDDPSEARLTPIEKWLPEHGTELGRPDTARDELATIVYTSGTTGKPKGVMLSHDNILSNAHAGLGNITVYNDDVFLSFLPLSHMLERTAGYYIPILTGATVAYARSIPELAEDLLNIKPTMLISVPRIFERVYNKVQAGLTEKPPVARKLFGAAVGIGWQRFQIRQGKAGWTPAQLLWPLLNALVARKILDRLGGRLRIAVSGGAPLPQHVARTFIGLGLNIAQGYGLTETSPIISANPLERNDPFSVGEPLRGLEVRLGENNELQVRGPSVMLGYWHNDEATHDTIDADGWLHTGDVARIVDNHVYITGRLKEVIVLANGEKVAPADLEMAITNETLFEQVMVLGEGRPFLSAVVVLNREHWDVFAGELGVDADDLATLHDSRVVEAVLGRIATQLREFPGYAAIYRVLMTLDPWTVENNLITPTLKLRRKQVTEKYHNEIDTLYAGH